MGTWGSFWLRLLWQLARRDSRRETEIKRRCCTRGVMREEEERESTHFLGRSRIDSVYSWLSCYSKKIDTVSREEERRKRGKRKEGKEWAGKSHQRATRAILSRSVSQPKVARLVNTWCDARHLASLCSRLAISILAHFLFSHSCTAELDQHSSRREEPITQSSVVVKEPDIEGMN